MDLMLTGADPRFCFGGQVERRMGWDMERGVHLLIGTARASQCPAPSPEILKCLKSLGHEMRILVHSRALLGAKLHCRLIRPVLKYACPVCHSCLTVAQSKALEFLQKRTLNAIFPGSEYTTNLSIAHVETESRRHIYDLSQHF